MHRWSQLFIPTLREAPADAEVASHKFLVRAGYVRQLASGIYSYLFLGQRSFNKITAIVREEMDRIGQEFYLPALHPRELWEASGRWSVMGENLFRLKDRKGAELCLAMTHEENMTEIARKELRSYKQLPQIWYQIQSKFRDEPRPKSGLLRVRQFLMKDSYSFDIDAAGLDASYQKHRQTYQRIFDRCGLNYLIIDAHSGAMGGSQSEEFMVYTPAGEDQVVSCANCKYAANLEKATSKLESVEDLKPEGDGKPLEVHTPGMKTIEEVARFLGVSPKNKIKTLALMAKLQRVDRTGQIEQDLPVIVFVRGDHSLNEAKLVTFLKAIDIRPMTDDEIRSTFNSPAGYLGPLGIIPAERTEFVAWSHSLADVFPGNPATEKIYEGVDPSSLRTAFVRGRPFLLVDKALEGRTNLIAGANREDYHVKNITPGKDFQPTAYADLRAVATGDACPNCGSPLRMDTAVEIGHIFKLGQKYTISMNARVLDKNGKEVTPIMGSYGIGIERILTSAIEQSNDENGFWLPRAIAPFDIVVTPTNVSDEKLKTTAESIANRLESAGFDVLLDDRDERPGVKFKDADLVGIPFRVNVGKKVTEDRVEVVQRSTRQSQDVSIAGIVEYFQEVQEQAHK